MNNRTTFTVDGKEFYCPLMLEEAFTVRSVPRSYQVSWDESPYPIKRIKQVLEKNEKNLLLIDENIFSLYGDDLKVDSQRIFIVKATETAKSLDGIIPVFDFLQSHQFTKGETLVVVGGGIVQDMGAFVAACFKRGIPWVHFPTTLLSMCDSCIGGKTGINYKNAKNQLALFSSPSEVIINPYFLNTLTDDAIRSGLGEILKLFITGGTPFLNVYRHLVKQGKVVEWHEHY